MGADSFLFYQADMCCCYCGEEDTILTVSYRSMAGWLAGWRNGDNQQYTAMEFECDFWDTLRFAPNSQYPIHRRAAEIIRHLIPRGTWLHPRQPLVVGMDGWMESECSNNTVPSLCGDDANVNRTCLVRLLSSAIVRI